MLKLLVKKKRPKVISLKDHYERRNRILIKRKGGGFGDTLMARMMFEDFASAFPGVEVTFTCPPPFIDMATNHPYANAVSLRDLDETQYGSVYDVSTACRTHELRYGPKNTSNRSDIWAAHCGVELAKHDMYLVPQPDMIRQCTEALKYYNKENKLTVLLVTQSHHPGSEDEFSIGKSLDFDQTTGIVEGLREKGYYVYTVHSEKRADYDRLGVDQFTRIHAQAWIAMVAIADYVITVDTATFHIAGGLKKPTLAIFTFTNKNPYSRYYTNMELIQGPCPYNTPGCFTTQIYCQKADKDPYPCRAGLTPSNILEGFDRLVAKFPVGMSPTSESVQKKMRIDLPVHTT